MPVYRWVLPEDVRPLRRLVEQTVAGAVDCMTFTSAPAVSSTLTVARELGREDELVEALRGPVLVAAVGPVTAGPLDRAGIPSVQPERARLGALVRTVVEELPARRTRTTRAGDHVLELRGHCVLVDGRSVELTARQVGVLSALVDGGGRVLSRADLLRTAWRDEPADEHAVEMTVARLRSALGPAGRVVETVVKRGYRLAALPEPGRRGVAAGLGDAATRVRRTVTLADTLCDGADAADVRRAPAHTRDPLRPDTPTSDGR